MIRFTVPLTTGVMQWPENEEALGGFRGHDRGCYRPQRQWLAAAKEPT
jgi:hypothetical protein